MAVWKIFINDVEQKYLSLNFERKLMINTPTEFEATIMYSNNIHIMDIVKITRNDIVEWKGYIEELNPKWDEDKHVLNISGRDATFILWKKWSDDFCNFAEKTSGFFGAINPLELVKFILNTPKTQIGLDYPYNKEGWGLDFSRSFTECNATRTSMGEPNWVITRKRGYGWYNSGKDELKSVTLTIDNISFGQSTTWTTYPKKYPSYYPFLGVPFSTYMGYKEPIYPYLNDSSNSNGIIGDIKISQYDDISDNDVGSSTKAVEVSFHEVSNDINIISGVSLSFNYYMHDKRYILNPSGYPSFDVYIYKSSTDTWIPIAHKEESIRKNTWLSTFIDISENITTVSDINNMKVRFINRTENNPATLTIFPAISNVQLHVNTGIREASQINGEYFEVKFVPSRICAVYIESRGGKFLELDNKTIVPSYARNYSIKTYDSSTGEWVTLIPPVYDNKYPNIIHSFKPIFTDNLRITLEGDYSNNVPWGISQIYVYLADGLTPVMTGVDDKGVPIYTVKSDPENKYRILLHEGETDISTPPDTVPYVYTGGPYIKKILIEDEYTGEPIGPLNVGKQRVLEAVNYVMGLCSTDSELGYGSFTPYEWWIDMDDDNTFHVAKRKGADKSDSIIFESGVNMGLCDYRVFVNDTVQRVYVVGQGEQKKLQDTSVWVNTSMLDENDDLHNAENDVRTFYEDVIQNKTVIIDEHHGPVVGTVIGRANLSINAKPRTQLVINLTKDTFTSAEGDELAYDVGDTVSVVDSLNDIDLKLRIYNIEKSVREGIGEEIVITLGYPNYKYQDTLQQMYSNIKTLGVVGTLNNDWTAEGTDRKLLDARRISKASQQTVNAQNDNISQTIAADTQDWWWTYDNEEERNDDHQYGQEFLWGNNYMGFMGVSGDNNIGQQHKISAVLKGNIVPVHDPNNDKTMPIDIPMWTCPHFIIDIKCCDGIFSDVANAEWKYNRWTCEEVNYGTNTYNSDYCRLGLGAEDGVAGFYFLIRKARESPSQFDIYMIYIFSDGTNNLTPNTPITSIEQIDSAILFKNYGTFLKTIQSNRKYRLEIITESDPKFIATATPNVQFNIYEYTEMIKSGDTTNLDYQLKKYPTMGIVQNQSIPNELVKAFYGEFRTTCHGKDIGMDSDQSILYFYNFKTEWRVLELQG